MLALEQGKESEGALKHRLRRGEAARRHVAGDDRVARVESDLHPEHGRALDMSLHGSRELAEDGSEGVDKGRGVEPGEAVDGRGRAERPGCGGPEEPQRARRGNPEMACDVDPESECGQEVASPDAALALGPCEGRGNGNGEGVDDRALVHAVKLRVVDLVAVTHRRPGRGEARAV